MRRRDIIRRTLEWCNRQRVKQGLPILTEMPKGIPVHPESCPCGRAANMSVGLYNAYALDETGRPHEEEEAIRLPESVREFVRMFDSWQIPELVDHEAGMLR